jgi:hypothetical protein
VTVLCPRRRDRNCRTSVLRDVSKRQFRTVVVRLLFAVRFDTDDSNALANEMRVAAVRALPLDFEFVPLRFAARNINIVYRVLVIEVRQLKSIDARESKRRKRVIAQDIIASLINLARHFTHVDCCLDGRAARPAIESQCKNLSVVK